jgi:hypothetical protein
MAISPYYYMALTAALCCRGAAQRRNGQNQRFETYDDPLPISGLVAWATIHWLYHQYERRSSNAVLYQHS